jgi:hypothetical protein
MPISQEQAAAAQKIRTIIADMNDEGLDNFLTGHSLVVVISFLFNQLSDEGKKEVFEALKAQNPNL